MGVLQNRVFTMGFVGKDGFGFGIVEGEGGVQYFSELELQNQTSAQDVLDQFDKNYPDFKHFWIEMKEINADEIPLFNGTSLDTNATLH